LAHYCLICGSQLQTKWIENREREFCSVCGWINYEQLKVSAGCRIELEGKLLLVQRKNPPFKETWHFPSGYVEVDEYPPHAAERETLEECGLVVSANYLAGAYFYDDDPRGSGVVLMYSATINGGELSLSDETLAVKFFMPDELPALPLAGMSALASIQDWLAEKKNG